MNIKINIIHSLLCTCSGQELMKPELERDPIWRTIPCAKVYSIVSRKEIHIACEHILPNLEKSFQLPPPGDYGAEGDHQPGTVGNDSGSAPFVQQS